MLLKTLSGQLKHTDEERSALMWSDDKAKSTFPLWWSQHPATLESKRVDLFGLALIFHQTTPGRRDAGSVFHLATRAQVHELCAVHQRGTLSDSLFI